MDPNVLAKVIMALVEDPAAPAAPAAEEDPGFTKATTGIDAALIDAINRIETKVDALMVASTKNDSQLDDIPIGFLNNQVELDTGY